MTAARPEREGPLTCPTCGGLADRLCTQCNKPQDSCRHRANFRWRSGRLALPPPGGPALTVERLSALLREYGALVIAGREHDADKQAAWLLPRLGQLRENIYG